jgi:protein LTV1
MQHLRDVGKVEEGVESILIEAPTSSRKGKDKAKDPLELKKLLSEALPSETELSREQVYDAKGSIPADLEGLQPDMDPHLRQTLEALEDDAFVEDGLEEDFFAELVRTGEADDGEEGEAFEFAEYGLPDRDEEETTESGTGQEDEDEGWEARFARFKKTHEAKTREGPSGECMTSDMQSEGGDTVGRLPTISVIGGKKRRKGASDASGYSMSSSSMFRNDRLSLLDEHFDQVRLHFMRCFQLYIMCCCRWIRAMTPTRKSCLTKQTKNRILLRPEKILKQLWMISSLTMKSTEEKCMKYYQARHIRIS